MCLSDTIIKKNGVFRDFQDLAMVQVHVVKAGESSRNICCASMLLSTKEAGAPINL